MDVWDPELRPAGHCPAGLGGRRWGTECAPARRGFASVLLYFYGFLFLFYWLVDAIKRGTDKYSHTSVRAHAHTHAYLFTQHTQYQNKTNNKLGITTRLAGSSHKKERLI